MKTSLNLGKIFRRYQTEYKNKYLLTPAKTKVFHAVMNCRTEKLGAHKEICTHCGEVRISYNSCRNRHCPRCQFVKTEQWIHKRKQELLNIQYFHTVFTIPSELNKYFLQKPKEMYRLLFKSCSESIECSCCDRKNLGAKVGVIAVLHTWGQKMDFHPHVHCIVSGGGINNSGSWIKSREKYLVSVKILSKLLRGKFMQQFKIHFPNESLTFLNDLYKKDWVVYSKPTLKDPDAVISYLGRYTHRVAISNSRLIKDSEGKIQFSYKDYRNPGNKKILSLDKLEFIRRFLLHVLPPGFIKIRYYGFLSNRTKTQAITAIKTLLKMPASVLEKFNWRAKLKSISGNDLLACPTCGIGVFKKLFLFELISGVP